MTEPVSNASVNFEGKTQKTSQTFKVLNLTWSMMEVGCVLSVSLKLQSSEETLEEIFL